MKRIIIVAVCAIFPLAASAADRAKLTVSQAFTVAAALRGLDGHMVVTKQNGQENVILVPWEFGSGVLRLKIANNLSILSLTEKATEEARQNMVREAINKLPPDESGKRATALQPGTSEAEEVQRQYAEMLAQPAQAGDDLARIKASELKLDKNEIPSTVLAGLYPILDIDVALK